jgi:glycine/D-amino acid oxidase-like deaminating enzyme
MPADPSQTFYQASAGAAPRFAPLQGVQEADTAIVGGGYAGLATALGLMERGRARGTVLLEAETIGFGASGRNGGFVFGGFSLDCAALLRQLGTPTAQNLYRLTLDAVQRIRERILRYQIGCDAQYSGVLLANWFRDDAPLRAQQAFMRQQFGVDWQWLAREQTRELLRSERYHAALLEPNAFHFHPLKYAQGEARALLAGGVAVHEQSRVTTLTPDGAGWRLRTTQGAELRCRQVVVCCGGYIGSLYPALARAVLPIATYVMATEPLGAERLASALRTQAAVYDTRFAFDYYRPLADTRMLWGGRISIRELAPPQVERLLLQDLLRVYPQLAGVQVSHAWSGLMSYARHQMPQIGRLHNGLWYAMGFGGHGVAPTTLAGEVLAQALAGEADIPAGFSTYGLPNTFGPLGRAAAQATYWWAQWRDALRERL